MWSQNEHWHDLVGFHPSLKEDPDVRHAVKPSSVLSPLCRPQGHSIQFCDYNVRRPDVDTIHFTAMMNKKKNRDTCISTHVLHRSETLDNRLAKIFEFRFLQSNPLPVGTRREYKHSAISLIHVKEMHNIVTSPELTNPGGSRKPRDAMEATTFQSNSIRGSNSSST